MKLTESHFRDYLTKSDLSNRHPEMPDFTQIQFRKTHGVILYGPLHSGKYTQMLRMVRLHSSSNLKYEKKISINNKHPFFIKCSDIHYEVDMNMLGCNSKTIWNEIYVQLVDIIMANHSKKGFIVCKNFHEVDGELLDGFYSYIQKARLERIDIIFVLLTESLSFIPASILQSCVLLRVCVPETPLCADESVVMHEIIGEKIIQCIYSTEPMRFSSLRELLYDIFVYQHNVFELVWFIAKKIIMSLDDNAVQLDKVFISLCTFFRHYNNNYRPIFHVERLVLQLWSALRM